MNASTRREFLRTSSWAGLGLFAAGCAPKVSDFAKKSGRRVVVIGGGWGGATAAKYVRLADPSIEVVLLEPNKEFVSCPFSNLVLSGQRTIESLTFNYDGLHAHGVRVLHETATMIEPDVRRVHVGPVALPYDRLIVSPGVVSADHESGDTPWPRIVHAVFRHYALAYHGAEVNVLVRQ